MKLIFIFLFAFISIGSKAQSIEKGLDSLRQKMASSMKNLDSVMKRADSINFANSNRIDSNEVELNNRNLNSFMNTIRERQEKQKRNMWLRIGFGLAMLVILIVGILRKRKPKTPQGNP